MGKYENGNLATVCEGVDKTPLGKLSVKIPGIPLENNEFWVKGIKDFFALHNLRLLYNLSI